MRKQQFLFLIFVFVICTGFIFQSCAPGGSRDDSENSALSVEAPTLVRTDFMKGLNQPWDLAFTPGGTLYFTERCQGLSVRKQNGRVVRLFGTAGSAVVASDLFCEGQSGMHGVALDPQFASNRTLYIFMSSNLKTNPRTNRVVRLTVSPDDTSVSNRTDIVTDIAYKDRGNTWGGAGSHSGGRIRFGPDGFLYITTGDNHHGTLPQDLRALGGKILRVDRNGAAAPGNNTPTGGDPRIFTYGHRNVQGISFHPSTGQPYVSEHGPGHSDEVTPLVAGGNAGWDPKPDPGVNCADNYCGYISNRADGSPTSMTDLMKFPNALKPAWKQEDSAGMGPCLFLQGPQWKSWNGALAVGIMRTQRLDIVQLPGSGDSMKASLPSARLRSLIQGPDGNLYVATDEGEIWKVVPQ